MRLDRGFGAAPIEVLDAVDSTMAEAARRIQARETGPLWLLARRQTAGRGRQGRTWSSGAGDLAATLILTPAALRPGAEIAEAATLGYALGLAVADVLEARLAAIRPSPPAVTLKWPNDVLIGGEKAAGILLESRGGALAMGLGVNLVSAPPRRALEADALPATALVDHGREQLSPLGPETALRDIDAALGPRLAAWADGGFAALRDAWVAKAAGLGGPVRARLGAGREERGVFRTVDADGALVLDTAGGARRIFAADVHFGPEGASPEREEADEAYAARH